MRARKSKKSGPVPSTEYIVTVSKGTTLPPTEDLPTAVPWDQVYAEHRKMLEFCPSDADERVWAKIESMYRKINDLINGLPPDAQVFFWNSRFQKLAMNIESPWWIPQGAKMLALGLQMGEKVGVKIDEAKQRVKDHYTAKPRMTARDDEIVRLRDEENLDWDEILRRIRSNPKWATTHSGKLVYKHSLVVAYGRRKKATGK